MVAVSKSIAVEHPAKSVKAARNRIDLLLVVSDVLHSEKYHQAEDAPANMAVGLKSHIAELAELAAQAIPGKDSHLEERLKRLINFWIDTDCITADAFKCLKERVTDGLAVAQGAAPQLKKTYALPAYFGDTTRPWSELSASYMLEPLLRNPNRPIDGGAIEVMKFDKKQPSERVQKLLENYFDNIDLSYRPTADNPTGETKKFKLWLDPMGQLVKQNKETGETATVGNGYGWSTKFCQDMQEKGVPGSVAKLREEYKEEAARAVKKSRWNPPTSDRGREPPSSPRRYSYSSHSRSRSRSRSHSHSHSHSPSSLRYGSRSRSRSRSRSASHSRSDSGTRSRSRSRSDMRRQDHHSRPNSGGRQHQSSRNGEEKYNNRRNRFEDRGRQPTGNYSRKRTYDKQEHWNNSASGPSNTNKDFKQHHQQRNLNASMPYQAQGTPQAFPSPTAQPPRAMSGFAQSSPPPPPPPGPFPGFQNQGIPPPPPPSQPFYGGVAQPPPNFQGQFYGAPPNAGGFHNNQYQFGGPASNYQNNPGGYQGQQGNFRGGHHGGQRGRGGHWGQGRGQNRY